jgi:hypothetical protein
MSREICQKNDCDGVFKKNCNLRKENRGPAAARFAFPGKEANDLRRSRC